MIAISDVGKSFATRRGPVAALDGISVDVHTGEFLSLLGPSGCGKSTLLRLVIGLLEPDRGEIRVGGRAPSALRRAKQFALVPQTPALLPWRTVRQNALLLTQVNRAGSGGPATDAIGLLEEVGLGEFLDAYPHELSGGMQQRVALVRAFALGAPLLVMDEPFAALDEITRSQMRYLLLRLWEHHQATVLFVTHSIAEAVMLSDRVVVMTGRPGRVAHIEEIALPRPRHAAQEESPEFFALATALRHALHAEVM
ncbi:MAG TPA: ABC transporter ATP-binding protein [Acidimicrobiales bacterium]|nr:ABC transporter ATP-binding protein [Acidimicrobiales bacterium]